MFKLIIKFLNKLSILQKSQIVFTKPNKKKLLIFNEKKIFILFLSIYFIFWFKFSPVFRFAIPLFLSLIFILTINFFAYKEITKKFL